MKFQQTQCKVSEKFTFQNHHGSSIQNFGTGMICIDLCYVTCGCNDVTVCTHLKATIESISSDIHQVQLIKRHQLKLETFKLI